MAAVKLFISIPVLIFALTIYKYYIVIFTPSIPDILPDSCWGKTEMNVVDERIHNFAIDISQQEIDDFRLRLNMSRDFVSPLEGTQHQYGINAKLLQKIIDILKKDYNFRERQTFLNSYQQYTTNIQGLNIHYLHIVPENPDNLKIIPFLMLHGWPSSVREFYEVIPALISKHTNENKFVLELVIPSLIGFGYSEAPSKPGCFTRHVATMMKNLMSRLGYDRFFVHGSDWGALVAFNMAKLFPKNVTGLHSNFCFSIMPITILKMIFGSIYPRAVVEKRFENKMYPLTGLFKFYLAESGYLHLFGTKPDTIGHALDNTPQGLISYIVDKLSVGMDKNNIHLNDAGLEKYLDKILDIIVFYYWFPKTATTSARFYSENLGVHGFSNGLHNVPIDDTVPCACAFFEHEFIYQPQSFLRDKFKNLIQYNTYSFGGHFAAIEASDVLAEDMFTFIKKVVEN